MSTNQFPCNGPQRIQLPCPPVGGTQDSVQCYRVIFPRERIPVLEPGNTALANAADDEGYFPINALFLCAPGCKPAACEDATIFINDGLSRCSFFLNTAFVDGQVPTTALLVEYVIKVAAAGINSPVFHGFFVVSGQTPRSGLICSVLAPLCTQFEFWARVALGGPADLDVRLQMITDRLSGAFMAYLGPLSGGGNLPLPCCVPPPIAPTGLQDPTPPDPILIGPT